MVTRAPSLPPRRASLALVLGRNNPRKRRQRSIQRIPPLKLVMKSPLRNPTPSIRWRDSITSSARYPSAPEAFSRHVPYFDA